MYEFLEDDIIVASCLPLKKFKHIRPTVNGVKLLLSMYDAHKKPFLSLHLS